MYVDWTRKKVCEQILLRHSYREGVKKRTVLNLTRFPRKQVKAIGWALKNPNLAALVRGKRRMRLAGTQVPAPRV